MNFIYSSLGAFIGGTIYFLLGFFLDTKIDPKYSNLISNIISIFISILIQSYIFKKLHYIKKPKWLAIAFIFEIGSIILNQILFYLIKKRIDKNEKIKNNYKISITRILTVTILYFIYIYPMRRYILFNK